MFGLPRINQYSLRKKFKVLLTPLKTSIQSVFDIHLNVRHIKEKPDFHRTSRPLTEEIRLFQSNTIIKNFSIILNNKGHFLLLIKFTVSLGICLLKVNNRNTRTRCEVCSKLATDIFDVNFEPISHLALVFLLLTLNT